MDKGFTVSAHPDILHEDILDDATATGTRLQPEDPVQVGTAHFAIDGIDIPGAPGYFTAYHYTTVTVLHFAAFYDMVFRRPSYPPAILIPPGFDGNTIIP